MKRSASLLVGISLAAPVFAFAQSAIPIGPTALQLLTAVAAIEAQESSISNNQSLACAALFASPTVAVNTPVALAWGSYGAVSNASSSQSTYTPEGATYISLAKPGTWTYSFTFYGQNGASVNCNAKVTAVQ